MLPRILGRREVEARDDAQQPPVRLLRPRRGEVAAAQTGLDMRDVDARVERGEPRGHGRGRVALDDDDAGRAFVDDAPHFDEHARGDVRQRLIVLHEREVEVRRDAEQREHLVEHLPMLAGDAHADVERRRVAPQFRNDGSELDGLGARTENEEDSDGHRANRGMVPCARSGCAASPSC